jgi:DNA-directed RNA polymerase subunit RPC12/RpoP
MVNLYILGAGCSKNYSQSDNNFQGIECPINDNFFKIARVVCERTGESDPFFMEDIHFLIRTLSPLYGEHTDDLSFFSRDELRLEEVMTLLDTEYKLYSRFNSGLGSNESRQIRILKDLLARTLDYSLTGPTCKTHLKLAEKIQPQDLVISFNYDLLIDDALFALGKVTDQCYGLNFFRVNRNGKWGTPRSEPSQINLLKLHGSLNWVKCDYCSSVLLFKNHTQPMSGAWEYKCPRCNSDEKHAERMIIPPIQAKDYKNQEIAYLWVQAYREIMKVEKIICIGYSVPLTDFDMVWLLRTLGSKLDREVEVDFINPDPKREAEKRFQNLIRTKKLNHFDYPMDYL